MIGDGTKGWARHFVTGLLGKARAQLHGLGPKGEYPSRGNKYVQMHRKAYLSGDWRELADLMRTLETYERCGK